jgi:excinuclease ABC subunit B
MHSDIDTLERMQIIKSLRLGEFDVLVGINLLREGLDIPEVSLVVILDADKEGFLRSETALIQTCGRAARNVHGRVIMYADKKTNAIEKALTITAMRRQMQMAHNAKHNIVPRSVRREQIASIEETFGIAEDPKALPFEKVHLDISDLESKIKAYVAEMKTAAKEHRFEDAARARDLMRYYQNLEMMKADASPK